MPALVVLAFQDQIAEAILGPAWAAGTPLVGLTPGLLLGYGVFFLLGFTLFALIYASMGSFVSRPDDLQTLSLPLSFVAVAGYLSAILALSGGGGTWTFVASFLPPFSPFVMLARLMIGAVPPWQVALSIGILIVVDRRSWPSSRPGCTRPASCCTASAPASAPSSRRPARRA